MTTTQAVSIPLRYRFQETIREGQAVMMTRMLCLERTQQTRPVYGHIIDQLEDCPMYLKGGIVQWDIEAQRFDISCQAEQVPEGATADEVEAMLKRCGFREDAEFACYIELLDDHATEGMEHFDICRMRDERLELLGLSPERLPVDTENWEAVQFQVYGLTSDGQGVATDIPPMKLDTLMPCLPREGDRVCVSACMPELFEVAEVDSDRLHDSTVIALKLVSDTDETSRRAEAFRAVGFVDIS
ncbi:hypothetical protein AB1K70_19125 [Bremerella sp. JC770]|uniref:hypothetical protein n=1 Tax=Bremerella sp. JC770 TaxID=3232137 RepID=UPI003459B1CB